MLTLLEKAVLDLLLEKRGEPFETARQQLIHATVTKREFTGVGFFTEFALLTDAPVRHDLSDEVISGVGATFPGTEHGAGFLLFIRGGVITMLEGYTYADDPWPENTNGFRVFRDADKH